MRWITEGERRMREFECGKCGAEPGDPCRKPTGQNAPAHASRFWQATEAGRLPLDIGPAKASSSQSGAQAKRETMP